MKIQPVIIWQNGQQKEANNFSLSICNDNLTTSANFYFELQRVSEETDVVNYRPEILSFGNLTIEGADYQNWDASPSANEWAYEWAAGQLNLVLIPETL